MRSSDKLRHNEAIQNKEGGKLMALIHCPECDREISEKAAACPHCGYPVKPAAAEAYSLTHAVGFSRSGSGIFRALAWLCWIGGLVVAIFSSISVEHVYQTVTRFEWLNFLTTCCTWALYGGVLWSVGLLFDDVHWIYESVSSLQLVPRETQTKAAQSNKSNTATAPRKRQWTCKKCGCVNSQDAIFCKDCGTII